MSAKGTFTSMQKVKVSVNVNYETFTDITDFAVDEGKKFAEMIRELVELGLAEKRLAMRRELRRACTP